MQQPGLLFAVSYDNPPPITPVRPPSPRRPASWLFRLLRTYLGYVAGTSPQLSQVRLICKDELVS